MLYPFPFPFNPFSSSSSSTPTPLPLHLLFSSSPSFQVEQGNNCVEGSLKSGFSPEMAVKPTHQAVLEDLMAVNGQTGVSGDDFSVDDLLDFSREDVELENGLITDEEKDNHEQSKACSEKDYKFDPNRSNFSVKDDLGFVPGSELSVPVDDLADLEWLSHFVDDSFLQYPLPFPVGKLPEKMTGDRSHPGIPVSKNPCFSTPVQTKARSKRTRTGGWVWSLGSYPPTTATATETSSASSTSSSSSPLTGWLNYTGSNQTADSFLGKPPVKKQRKTPAAEGGGGGAHLPRRCSHCLVQKTPQWRTGPLGAKTLCNACGVRYKSGRLLPEYRPACSPTFSSDVHSNNHRKVLEMRQKKELVSGLTQPVQSF